MTRLSRIKSYTRRGLNRLNVDITRHPWPTRLAKTLSAQGISTVIDVGANEGQFAKSLRQAGFSGLIISAEPLSGPHGRLASAAARESEWIPLRTAVGATSSGTIDINISRNSVSSSVLPMRNAHLAAAPDSIYQGIESAPMTSVDAIIERYQIDPTQALLKIDVQGYEAEVLAGAEDAIKRLRAVVLEMSTVELYAGQTLYDENLKLLGSHGLQLWAVDPGFSRADDGRMLQFDGLFVRTSERG